MTNTTEETIDEPEDNICATLDGHDWIVHSFRAASNKRMVAESVKCLSCGEVRDLGE